VVTVLVTLLVALIQGRYHVTRATQRMNPNQNSQCTRKHRHSFYCRRHPQVPQCDNTPISFLQHPYLSHLDLPISFFARHVTSSSIRWIRWPAPAATTQRPAPAAQAVRAVLAVPAVLVGGRHQPRSWLRPRGQEHRLTRVHHRSHSQGSQKSASSTSTTLPCTFDSGPPCVLRAASWSTGAKRDPRHDSRPSGQTSTQTPNCRRIWATTN